MFSALPGNRVRPSVCPGGVMRSEMLPGRLRGELTEIVGRRAELALVRRSLGGARLVAQTGPGEIGKTRLAIQVASGLRRVP